MESHRQKSDGTGRKRREWSQSEANGIEDGAGREVGHGERWWTWSGMEGLNQKSGGTDRGNEHSQKWRSTEGSVEARRDMGGQSERVQRGHSLLEFPNAKILGIILGRQDED